ncbi:MAG: DUF4396 domain-containing protein [bacterium]
MTRHQKEHTHQHNQQSPWITSAYVTLHCLIGCTIGEILGLVISVSFAFGVWPTMGLATLLAFFVGLFLAVLPLIKREKIPFKQAWRIVWLGEVVSIAVMEVAMNGVDYFVGGINVTSVMAPIFWFGLAAGVPAGYIAALPVNYWLLNRHLKRCH